MNLNMQKAGGWAGLVAGATYIFGFVLLLAVLAPAGYFTENITDKLVFLDQNQALLYLWNFVIWIVNSAAMVVLALALFDRLKQGAPTWAQVGTAFGVIWAGLILAAGMVSNVMLKAVTSMAATDPEAAGTLYLALSHVENGIGGGNELAGGFWVLIICVAGWVSGKLPKALTALGAVVGLGGLSTLVPAFQDIGGSIFGLGFIVWFIWVGVVLLRSE